jgi:hypothetical protein
MKRPNVFLPPSPLRWQLFLTPKDRCYLLLLLLRVFGVCVGGRGLCLFISFHLLRLLACLPFCVSTRRRLYVYSEVESEKKRRTTFC